MYFVVIYVHHMKWRHTSYTQSWSTSCWLLSFPSHNCRYVNGGSAFAREDKTCATLHFYFECLLPFPSYTGGDHPLPLIIKSPGLFKLSLLYEHFWLFIVSKQEDQALIYFESCDGHVMDIGGLMSNCPLSPSYVSSGATNCAVKYLLMHLFFIRKHYP